MRSLFIWGKRSACLLALLMLAPPARPIVSDPAKPRFLEEKIGNASLGSPEQRILAAIDHIRHGKLADARATVNALLLEHPNYRLAHLLSGDLYAMRTMPLNNIGAGASSPSSDKLDDLRKEALARISSRQSSEPHSLLPAHLLVFAPGQQYAILVDAAASRVYVFKNVDGVPSYVTDHYATIGKLGADKFKEGDQRTPLGVYFVTSHLTRPYLDKTRGAQADLYGVGAWPISFPNEIDKSEGRTGSGIWLHGVPANTYARAPWASNGCVAMTNEEMLDIAQYIQIGQTPVVIVPKAEWVSKVEWQSRHDAALSLIDDWREEWESLKTQPYLSRYGKQFKSDDGQDLATWSRQKTSVSASKSWSKVRLDDLSIFASGGPNPRLTTSFKQDYRSNNLDNQMKKRQYWQQEDGAWKIIYEGAAT
ncbi:L,D-transpeptidase family protein [Iodobacter sp. CM08]|uniref:L,D-transpeptidase family protein n=1 Tax=Iodobacter sp. CM08 TaxID=3085902 RepID=UPI0029821F72|nr:L,D-transpeptidase family protein [Iodobacter sp. CM08]MDW5418202.1 L,D-transpeptidase family protein [Iodobacter sp. CM08]